MRVTLGMITSQIRSNLSNSAEQLLDAQNRASSGKRINKPSDDVPGVGRSLSLRSTIADMEQLKRNCNVASNYLGITSTTVSSAVKEMQQINSIAVQAANGTLSDETKKTLASQLDGISEQLVALGNTQHLGGYLFAGSTTNTKPIVTNPAGTPPYLFQGNSTQFVLQVNPGSYIPTTVTADMLFNMNSAAVPGSPDVFTMIQTLKDKILNKTPGEISEYSQQVKANLSNVIGIQSQIGARMNRLDSGRSMLETNMTEFKDMLSKTEDADFAEAAIDLQTRQNVYQAAISTASRVMQVSLTDFLK